MTGIAQPIAKTNAKYATAAALATSTYSSGVITASANGALSVDGQTVSASDVILVKNQATETKNGLYTVTTVGDGSNTFVLTRHSSMNADDEIAGARVMVTAGNTLSGSAWWVADNGPYVVGQTAINWVQLTLAQSDQSGRQTIAGGIQVGGTDKATIKGIYDSWTIAVTVPSITDPDIAKVDVDISSLTFAAAVGDAVIAIPLEALPTNCRLQGAWVSATDQVTVVYGSEGGNVTGAAKNHAFLIFDRT